MNTAICALVAGGMQLMIYRDWETPLNEITGTKAEFFNPFTSPNSGSPFLTIGGSISEPVLTVKNQTMLTVRYCKRGISFRLQRLTYYIFTKHLRYLALTIESEGLVTNYTTIYLLMM